MRKCGIAAGFVGAAACWVAYVLVELVICLTFALPFVVLLILDALTGERSGRPALTVVPPVPPRQPIAVPAPKRLAA